MQLRDDWQFLPWWRRLWLRLQGRRYRGLSSWEATTMSGLCACILRVRFQANRQAVAADDVRYTCLFGNGWSSGMFSLFSCRYQVLGQPQQQQTVEVFRCWKISGHVGLSQALQLSLVSRPMEQNWKDREQNADQTV